jgi:CPA2 family monovalent cation:H+ antiporter-2
MLIDPTTLYEYAFPVLILTLITILTVHQLHYLVLISGQPLKQSIQTGMSLAQIENSPIIATLGMSMNVTSNFLYPVIVGICNHHLHHPFHGKMATLFRVLERKLPRNG